MQETFFPPRLNPEVAVLGLEGYRDQLFAQSAVEFPVQERSPVRFQQNGPNLSHYSFCNVRRNGNCGPSQQRSHAKFYFLKQRRSKPEGTNGDSKPFLPNCTLLKMLHLSLLKIACSSFSTKKPMNIAAHWLFIHNETFTYRTTLPLLIAISRGSQLTSPHSPPASPGLPLPWSVPDTSSRSESSGQCQTTGVRFRYRLLYLLLQSPLVHVRLE